MKVRIQSLKENYITRATMLPVYAVASRLQDVVFFPLSDGQYWYRENQHIYEFKMGGTIVSIITTFDDETPKTKIGLNGVFYEWPSYNDTLTFEWPEEDNLGFWGEYRAPGKKKGRISLSILAILWRIRNRI